MRSAAGVVVRKSAIAFLVSLFLSLVNASFGGKLSVAPPSAKLGTMPPKVYVEDYYAPPPDFVPLCEIRDYTLNTRVPDYFWLKYDGAYTLALWIRPIAKKKIEQEIQAKLIDPHENNEALAFSDQAEKNEDVRSIIIRNLNEPADDLIGLSFKMRAKVRNAGARIKVVADGLGTLLTTRDEDRSTKCLDGFKAYKVAFAPRKGAVLRNIKIVMDPADGADFDQEFVIFDLMFRRRHPKPRFTDLPRRQWIRKKNFEEKRLLTVADGIGDVRALIDSQPGEFPSLDMPFSKRELRPRTKKESDGGFKLEKVEATINGEKVNALRITLTHGPRCYIKFPFRFNAMDYNTMTFFAKIRVPKGLKPLVGNRKPMLWGTNAKRLNEPFDTFGIGLYSATHDFEDWGRWGVVQAMFTQNLERNAKAPKGWRVFAYDIINSDPSGNKSAFYPKITHWTFYYDNKKIPKGCKVVVTIAAPKVTRGLMYAGGDMRAYSRFLADGWKWRLVDDAPERDLEPPSENRLERPIKFIVNHVPKGAVYMDLRGIAPAYRVIVERAAKEMLELLNRKFATKTLIPVFHGPPPGNAVNSIVVGGRSFRKVSRTLYDSDMKVLKGTPGCAIRSDGSNVYIYAADFNYAGPARGLANGIYTFLENNTDVIFVNARKTDPRGSGVVFDTSPSGDFDIAWGLDYRNAPLMKVWGISGMPKWQNDRNRAARSFVWGNWEYGGVRSRQCNHWWGYGTGSDGRNKGKPNETWGIGKDGKRMRSGCYTGHPCLIRVLEKAKEEYVLKSGFNHVGRRYRGQFPRDGEFAWNSYDVHGLWLEDTLKVCQCAECATPIRLADGFLVRRGDEQFLSTQFYSNGCAMINAVNVYARRDAKVESIAYFWMTPIPLFNISRNYKIRFCPYIRKNYFVPIYAPINDTWWRWMYRWSQMDVTTSLYEYFLFVKCRPYADVFKYDFPAEAKLGYGDIILEGDTGPLAMMERWVVPRLMWESWRDVSELRGYFLRRAFREAAPDMKKFYETLYALVYRDYAPWKPMEFEDLKDFGRLALRTKSAGGANRSIADDLDDFLDSAVKHVANPEAKRLLTVFRESWDKYMAAARKMEGKSTKKK